MTDRMLPFRSLLKPGTSFEWDDTKTQLFEESKGIIVSEIEQGVKIFDKTRPTCLATDWSKTGIGFWLFQKHCSCTKVALFCCSSGWKITLVGSRFTHAAESRYAPIEGEALAVADALDKARYFVLGCKDLIIAVDHKPLLKIFGDRALDNMSNNRLRNLKEKTLRYKFTMIHNPGVKNKAADTVSRHPTGDTQPERFYLTDDISSAMSQHREDSLSDSAVRHHFLAGIRCNDDHITQSVDTSSENGMLSTVTWDKVRQATSSDDNMNHLLTLIESGMPMSRHDLPVKLQEYHQHRDNLHVVDGVIIYRNRIVIPPALRQTCLNALHAAHQSVSSMISAPPSHPSEQTVGTAIEWHHHSPAPLRCHSPCQTTRSSASVRITSRTRVSTTSPSLIDTQTGLLWRGPLEVPTDWWMSSVAALSHMAFPMSCPPTEDRNSLQATLENFSNNGESTIACHQSRSLTATVAQR